DASDADVVEGGVGGSLENEVGGRFSASTEAREGGVHRSGAGAEVAEGRYPYRFAGAGGIASELIADLEQAALNVGLAVERMYGLDQFARSGEISGGGNDQGIGGVSECDDADAVA